MKTFQDIMHEVKHQETVNHLIRKLLIFDSPLTNEYEYRVAYFFDNTEASIWEDRMRAEYTQLNITHEVYTDLI